MKLLIGPILLLAALCVPRHATFADNSEGVDPTLTDISEFAVDPLAERIEGSDETLFVSESHVSEGMIALYLGKSEIYSTSDATVVGDIVELEEYKVRPFRTFTVEEIETLIERQTRTPKVKEKKSLWEGSIGTKVAFQLFPESNPLLFLRFRW